MQELCRLSPNKNKFKGPKRRGAQSESSHPLQDVTLMQPVQSGKRSYKSPVVFKRLETRCMVTTYSPAGVGSPLGG